MDFFHLAALLNSFKCGSDDQNLFEQERSVRCLNLTLLVEHYSGNIECSSFLSEVIKPPL